MNLLSQLVETEAITIGSVVSPFLASDPLSSLLALDQWHCLKMFETKECSV